MPLLRRSSPPVASVLARLDDLRVTRGWTPSAPAGELPAVDDGAGLGVAPAHAPPPSGHPTGDRGSGGPGDAPRVSWRGGRFDPGRRGAAALVVLAVLVALLSATVVLRARPHEVAAPTVTAPGRAVPGGPRSAVEPGSTQEPTGPPLVVAIDGKVAHPGLVRLPAGSRVDDGLRAAGGVLPGTDLAGLNLARKLVDGEQVVVGAPPPPAAGPGPGAASGGVLDLNAATVTDLDALPGVGPVLAQHIVDWRTEHGRFGSVDQLREVSGIGESKYAQLKARVRV